MQTRLSGSAVKTKNLLWTAPFAGLIAAFVNAGLFGIFFTTGIISEAIVIPGQGPITLVPVMLSSFIPALLAGVVLALLGKFSRQPFRIFRIMAIVLLLLSFINPFLGIPGISLSMGMALNMMHLVVAFAVVVMFEKYARRA